MYAMFPSSHLPDSVLCKSRIKTQRNHTKMLLSKAKVQSRNVSKYIILEIEYIKNKNAGDAS